MFDVLSKALMQTLQYEYSMSIFLELGRLTDFSTDTFFKRRPELRRQKLSDTVESHYIHKLCKQITNKSIHLLSPILVILFYTCDQHVEPVGTVPLYDLTFY